MKKILKKVTKLIDFLIKVLTRCIKVGVKLCDEYQAAGDKIMAVAQILQEVGEIVHTLQDKKQQIERLANEE